MITILLDEPVATINRNIYGHFAEHLGTCIYEGIWSGGALCPDVVTLLKKINPPVVRWPGGCFADDYHWQDGIGPVADRPRRINIHWGEVVESNAFGTHEFIQFCRAIGAEPYICGNVGSGTPHELRDWVEYCNFPSGTTLSDMRAANGDAEPLHVRFWGVGNENWGCGGNFTPEDYGTEYRRFSTYLCDFGSRSLYLIACGPNGNDLAWTEGFFNKIYKDYKQIRRIHGYAAHYYCRTAGTSTEYTNDEWYQLLYQAQMMEPLVVQQRALMDTFDPERKVELIVDEWGTWHPPAPGRNPRFLWQQNTLRDALVAALTLDIFNRHADKVVMANIAQTVNVLQSLLLVEDGKTITTPTYHVYDLYKTHQDAQSLRTEFNQPDITYTYEGQERRLFGLAGSASRRNNTVTLTVVNPHIGVPVETGVRLNGDGRASAVQATVLTNDDIHAHNTFDAPNAVTLSEPQQVNASGSSFRYTFAPQSVTRLDITLG